LSNWAQLDKDNKVISVIVCDNNDPNGDVGYQWLLDNLGGTWVQTSYNGNIRYNYAGIGYNYDPDADAFIAPRPDCGHKELFLSTTNYQWQCQACDLVVRFKNETEV